MSSSLLISSKIIKVLIPPILLILIKVRYIRSVMLNKLISLLILLSFPLWLWLWLEISMLTHPPWIKLILLLLLSAIMILEDLGLVSLVKISITFSLFAKIIKTKCVRLLWRSLLDLL